MGQGKTYEEALADVKSAIEFHIESFGDETLTVESSVIEAFLTDAQVNA